MAKCDFCGTTIVFGGKKDGQFRFCNDKCFDKGGNMRFANEIPQDVVDEAMLELHKGQCRACEGPGPVDVHTAHTVWSILIMTSWNSTPYICCNGCGKKKKVMGIFSTFFLGWWGFPHGLLMTPIQIVRNFAGLFSSPDPDTPSEDLENIVRVMIAQDILEQQAQG